MVQNRLHVFYEESIITDGVTPAAIEVLLFSGADCMCVQEDGIITDGVTPAAGLTRR